MIQKALIYIGSLLSVLLIPGIAFASGDTSNQLDLTSSTLGYTAIFIFAVA